MVKILFKNKLESNEDLMNHIKEMVATKAPSSTSSSTVETASSPSVTYDDQIVEDTTEQDNNEEDSDSNTTLLSEANSSLSTSVFPDKITVTSYYLTGDSSVPILNSEKSFEPPEITIEIIIPNSSG